MSKETIADIVAEKRARANEIEGAAGRNANQFQRELIADLRAEADRIEAAWKLEMSQSMEELVLRHEKELSDVRLATGNAAAMREALEKIGAMEIPHNFQIERSDIVDACYDLTRAIKLANAALAKPPRNCDVGTVEGQVARFHAAGETYHTLTLRNALAWAQMPYEEGGAK